MPGCASQHQAWSTIRTKQHVVFTSPECKGLFLETSNCLFFLCYRDHISTLYCNITVINHQLPLRTADGRVFAVTSSCFLFFNNVLVTQYLASSPHIRQKHVINHLWVWLLCPESWTNEMLHTVLGNAWKSHTLCVCVCVCVCVCGDKEVYAWKSFPNCRLCSSVMDR